MRLIRTEYKVAKMDCPAEEKLIRLKLEGFSQVKKLDFNIEARKLVIFHSEKVPEIEKSLMELDLGSKLLETKIVELEENGDSEKSQSKLLWAVLIINFAFFIIEITAGIISSSMGLIADSLDMLADALVYGLSLWVVGASIARKKKVATISGYFQIVLAACGLVEIIRRFVGFDTLPDFRTMIGISFLSLAANSVCLYLLQKSKSKEAHMKASMIFTSNDVIINSGVILAGILVVATNSKYPDLIVGTIIFLIVVRGAIRILELGK
jgi:Co/Zn/Cd efflux system component